MPLSKSLHVSVGAGFENDRRDLGVVAAQALATMPEGPRYLIFECLAERTLAKQVMADSLTAQIELALSHLEPSRDLCAQHGIRVVTNLGGIDPEGVARGVQAVLGSGCRIAAVSGDRLTPVPEDGTNALAKNIYAGAAGIVSALQQQADIVITGRVADPALTLGPAVHELSIEWDDWNSLANATLAGHLIECCTQITGGYFSDEYSDVPDLANVGPPVATVTRDAVQISKPCGGGIVNRATVIEQMLYEIGDPSCYITPDVILDLSKTQVIQKDKNEVMIHSAIGHPAPSTLKTLLCRQNGWFGEATIIYCGSTAAQRANAAKDILTQRIRSKELRLEILQGQIDDAPQALLRMAIRSATKLEATEAINELEALYLNGPSAGGGVRSQLTPLVETLESLVPREQLKPVCQVIAP